jgi:hypothetical protein
MTTDHTEATKHDVGKLRMDLLPPYAIEQIARVMTEGASKYGDRNWEKGMDWGRMYAASLRHLFAWWGGEEYDKEDGISHLAHAACDIVFLLSYSLYQKGKDDRSKELQPNWSVE